MDANHKVSTKIVRFYERYPWTLENDLKHKDDEISYFAVTYSQQRKQVLAVYDGYFNASDDSVLVKRVPTLNDEMIELRPILGAVEVNDMLELSYDFNRTNQTYYDGLVMADQFKDQLQ